MEVRAFFDLYKSLPTRAVASDRQTNLLQRLGSAINCHAFFVSILLEIPIDLNKFLSH
jgi:hypothetical protein